MHNDMTEITHQGQRLWHFVQEEDFSVPYDFLEKVFTDQARQEGFITEKQCIRVKNLSTDDATRMISLKTELFKLLEN